MDYYDIYQQYLSQLKRLGYDGKYLTFRDLRNIVSLKISMFYYENLPEGLNSYILERALFFKNNLCFAKIDGLDKVVLCTFEPQGERDIYNLPTKVRLVSFNGIQLGNQDYQDIVLVRDNPMDVIPLLMVTEYTDIITEIEETLSINLNHIRLPLFFIANPKDRATINELMKKIKRGDKYAVLFDKNIQTGIQTNNISLPVSPDIIYDLRMNFKKELLTSLGIYSTEEKREKLINAEVEKGNDYADLLYAMAYDERKRFIDEVNDKFNLSIKLKEKYDTIEKDKYQQVYNENLAKVLAENHTKDPSKDENKKLAK